MSPDKPPGSLKGCLIAILVYAAIALFALATMRAKCK